MQSLKNQIHNFFSCPMDKCEHWGKATKYPRKCYYEAQCWKGQLLMMRFLIKMGWDGVSKGEGKG